MTDKPQIISAAFSMRERRMLGLNLDSWNNMMVGFLAIASVFGVLAALSTFCVVRLQGEAARESAERIEKLRAENLALQKILTPRRLLPIVPPDKPELLGLFAALKNFAGTTALIQVVPDFEAQMLANDLAATLNASGWKFLVVDEKVTHAPSVLIREGIEIHSLKTDKSWAAGEALAALLTKAGLGAGVFPVPHFELQEFNPHHSSPNTLEFPIPPNSILVTIGMKPATVQLMMLQGARGGESR